MAEDSSFIDDIVQDDLPQHTDPLLRTFQPWHRVKKEYIRQEQWNLLTVRMLKRIWNNQLIKKNLEWPLDDTAENTVDSNVTTNDALDGSLKCLVIPGDDLLDIRSLWRDMDGLNCSISYLGFNVGKGSSQKGTRIHVAHNAVTSLPGIKKQSLVLPDRFEAIASAESQAYRMLKQYGPFHVVNLDLCRSIFPNKDVPSKDFYDALKQLITFQLDQQRTEWLLFITTMVEPKRVDLIELTRLCQPTFSNVNKHADFKSRVTQLLPTGLFQGMPTSLNVTGLSEKQMIQLFGVALGKYVLMLCQTAMPRCSVIMRRSFRHTIKEDKGAVMLSLAFSFKPNFSAPQDDTGVTSPSTLAPKHYPDDRECSIRLITSVETIRDVDEELQSDKSLRNRLMEDQADLLKDSGYDRVAYLTWVKTGEKAKN